MQPYFYNILSYIIIVLDDHNFVYIVVTECSECSQCNAYWTFTCKVQMVSPEFKLQTR